ncbi:finTRIM family, member 67 [Misgurnus anguillicaudatus]|uniref:finTRIM family, member 67 n=1 Tax=Misgurnus anguillicaudatus TaxID=75329 RepID=UPI0024353049|nr:finTRIM family, member 67 [Misgurnus anguillicaudatus]
MAQAGVFLEHDQFNCSICLDVLKDPVTVPCGHSYCKACITGYWDQDDYLGIYGCPQCRQSFAPRPVLGRNTMLADVVEKLKKTELNAADIPSEPTHAEPGDVECDVCSGKKNKAFKSCLVCLASFCESHVQAHYESPAFQKHKLASPSRNLHEQLCRHHDKLLEVFCRTDQQCICYLCLTDDHKGHDTVMAATEMNERKNALAEMQRNTQQRIEEREKELADLRRATQMLTNSAQKALDESERIFTELVCSIERRRTEVKELIRGQERAAVSQAESVVQQLEQEITELKKRHAEIGQLSQTDDHIAFLRNCRSLCAQPVSAEVVPSIFQDPNFETAVAALVEFQALLDDVCQGGFVNISEKVNDVTIIQPLKPNTDSESNAGTALNFGQAGPIPFTFSVPTFNVSSFSSYGSRTPGSRQRLQPRRRRR